MKKIMLIIWMILFSIGAMACSSQCVKAQNSNVGNPKILNGETTWDCIWFGNYFQSDSSSKEPIKWRVLSVNENEAFLLSDKILDMYAFTVEEYLPTNIVWENSGIREWLNNYFYKNAFSDEEKKYIYPSYNKNDDFDWYMSNPEIHTDGGNDTTDYIFCLSLNEVDNQSYGFVSEDVDGNVFNTDTRYAEYTDYAAKGGVVGYRSYSCRYHRWFLRTPGFNYLPLTINQMAPFYAYYADGDVLGVRPAIKINLENDLWENADTVTATHGYIDRTEEETTTESFDKPQETQKSEQNTVSNKTDGKTIVSVKDKKIEAPIKVGKTTIPAKASIKKVIGGKKKATILIHKMKNADGYLIQYSANRKLKKAKKKYTKNIKVIIKKLKSKKAYYFRIKAYKFDGKKKIFSKKWSNVKKVKVK